MTDSDFVPCLPENAPFTPEQRAYLNGFFAGLYSRTKAAPATAPAEIAPPLQSLTILFGSQTGNAENLAKRAAKEAGKCGFAATVFDLAQYPGANYGGYGAGNVAALLNAARHAQADQITLSLQMVEKAIHLTVHDNGTGIQSWQTANQPGSHGLTIMRERAEAFDGNLNVRSIPGQGTTVEVTIPIKKDGQNESREDKDL